jgi:hypothetical protein
LVLDLLFSFQELESELWLEELESRAEEEDEDRS